MAGTAALQAGGLIEEGTLLNAANATIVHHGTRPFWRAHALFTRLTGFNNVSQW